MEENKKSAPMSGLFKLLDFENIGSYMLFLIVQYHSTMQNKYFIKYSEMFQNEKYCVISFIGQIFAR